MSRFATALAGAILLLLAGLADASAQEACRRVTSAGEGYAVCTIDMARQRLRLLWRAPDGTPYGSLKRVAEAQGSRLVFAMNAGMYDPDLAPVGLYVEDGRELKAANRAGGPGNFHLKPNGIFYVGGGRAGVVETERYLRLKPRAEFATQSGPMLVIAGRLHPRISAEGPSRKVRNGVGVRDSGRTAIVAISDGPVSFGAFARLFRDELGTPDALFLDGSVSGLWAPSLGRTDLSLRSLGPILAATRP